MGGRAGGGASGEMGKGSRVGAGGVRDVKGNTLLPAGSNSEWGVYKSNVMTNYNEFMSGKKGVTPQYQTKYVVSAKQDAGTMGGVQQFHFNTPKEANAFAAKVAKSGYKWDGLGSKTLK